MPSLNIEGIEVIVNRKAIRHLYLRVTAPEGIVTVSAPRQCGNADIESFIRARLGWIRRKIENIRLEHQPRPFPPASVQVWGSHVALVQDRGGRNFGIALEDGVLRVRGPAPLTPAIWDKLRAGFFGRLVKAEAPPKIDFWREKLGLGPVRLTVRRMKSRWGTCCPARRHVTLNSEIAGRPPACLEHVIVHELLHFFEPNHGPAFKAAMDKWLPDWRATDKLLK